MSNAVAPLEGDPAERKAQLTRAATARYKAKHAEIIKIRRTAWCRANAEKLRAAQAKFRVNNLDKIKAYSAKTALDPVAQAKRAAARKAKALLRTDADRKRTADYQRNRLRSKPKLPVDARMSRQVSRYLSTGKGGRSWQELVGYKREQLYQHIERLFSKGMSWANMHAWHIDHIVPLRSFDFTTANDSQFRAAWALSNLRPLWKQENLSKGSKRLFLL